MTRLHVPVHLRWGDMDAYRHVNNATLVKLLEEARVRAFWRHEDADASADTAIFDTGAGTGAGEAAYLTLVASQSVDYLAPIPYRQAPLDIVMWFTKLGGSSAHVAYEVWDSPAQNTLFARAATVIVLVDPETGRPVRLPEAVRAAWTPFLENPAD